jgi:hypothetical protein
MKSITVNECTCRECDQLQMVEHALILNEVDIARILLDRIVENWEGN